MELDKHVWAARLEASVSGLSRTAHGHTQEAYGGAKPALEVTDRETLKQMAKRNLQKAIGYVWEYGPAVRPQPLYVESFMNAVSVEVSRGLVSSGEPLFRTWDISEKYPEQTPPAKIAQELQKLYVSLAHVLERHEEVQHPVRAAAVLEREVDWRIHPYADGCGRCAKLFGAWMLLRGGMYPALFTGVRTYYDAMADPVLWSSYYRDSVAI